LTIFRSVTTKARIIRSQEINGTGEMNVTCRMGSRRLVEKGLEVDVIQSVEISGETAWECLQTFFYRGRFGVPGPNHSMSGIVAIPDAPLIGEWFLPEGLGFRFAKISGDSNGIHFSSRYARMLGFERDFVQPMRVLSKALEFIPSSSTFPSVSSHLESDSSGEGNPMIHQLNKGWNKSNTLEIVFKGPIYYDQRVEVRGIQIDSGFRFDLYAGHNPRPCICGLLI